MPLMLLLAGCPGTPDEPDDTKTPGDDTGTEPVELLCEEPVEPSCVDELIQELSFQDDEVSEGEVSHAEDGADFVTLVDATAGGMNQSSSNPWVYVRFTRTGAERVDVNDEDSLEDMTWHLALRRYQLRLNSGDSGPSCVHGAEMSRRTYEELTSVPDALEWEAEDFYDDDCELRTDALGGPETVMNGWWAYGSCVETTLTPYLLQLEDGGVLKVVVESYYEGDGQAECNEGGSTREEGGWITLRWQFLG
ncbi:MAG: HmuY family protein [Myxococcota bacterium]